MKPSWLALAFMIAAFPLPSLADGKPETIHLKGDDYTVSRDLPREILGLYKYEGQGEPIVEIRADGTGAFQPHGMAPIPIRIWIDVDADGVPRRQVGTELRYRYTLLIQYGEGGGGNYPAGGYDLIDVTMLKDDGRAVVLGERACISLSSPSSCSAMPLPSFKVHNTL